MPSAMKANGFSIQPWTYETPVLSGHSKIDKRNILMANGSFMKVESIDE